MSDQREAMRNAGLTESAFGRPASWWASWPALAVGLSAFLLAVYGTWWLPRRLPAQYAQALEKAQQQYQQIADKSKTSGGQRLIDAAGNLNVIYSRLVDLEGNSPERYWQWAEFQLAHADRLNASLKDPALSLSPSVREHWIEQAEHFQSKSQEILEQLAVRPSELQARATLQVAHRKYHQGLAGFGVREATKLAEEVTAALDSANSATNSATRLTADEIEAGQLLLVQLQLEAAWQKEARSSLTCDTARLDRAWGSLERFQSQHPNAAEQMQWQITRRLLLAFQGKDLQELENEPEIDNGVVDVGGSGAVSSEAWKSDLATLQLAAIDGDWVGVANQLRSRTGSVEPAVSSGLARTICRLAVSPLAQRRATEKMDSDESESESEGEGEGEGEGADDAERRATLGDESQLGVLLAVQLGMHLPECSELLWECARLQAGQGSEHAQVPAAIPQSIMSGQSGWLKHSLAALSATLEGQATVARTHLQLLSRSRGNPPLVARVALWRTQMLSAGDAAATSERNPQQMTELNQLRELLGSVVQLEPDNGLNWFVLGTLQFQTGELEDMRRSLDKARVLLGDVPAIEQMLGAAEGIATEH